MGMPLRFACGSQLTLLQRVDSQDAILGSLEVEVPRSRCEWVGTQGNHRGRGHAVHDRSCSRQLPELYQGRGSTGLSGTTKRSRELILEHAVFIICPLASEVDVKLIVDSSTVRGSNMKLKPVAADRQYVAVTRG